MVVTSGGPGGPRRLCDSAARFETYARGETGPTWVNFTGGDSLYSVAVTGAAVYVGGHQRWLDNPGGSDSAGPGAVERPGIGAIHPVTGKALSWNPTRERGIGVKAFLAHRGGYWLVVTQSGSAASTMPGSACSRCRDHFRFLAIRALIASRCLDSRT
nr:hypothetical protein GCM10020093_082230 [Planobispora longispora]